MPDAEALKIRKWAETGDRTDPDDTTLNPALSRAAGWPSEWSATDGEKLRRQVMNQLFRELTGAARDVMERGILEWDDEIDYPVNAYAQSGGEIQRATVATGPATSNATDPQDSGQTIWVGLAGAHAAPEAPDAPTSVVGQGSLFWAWNCPLDGGREVTEFEVRWRASGGSWSSPISVDHAFYELTGLTNGQLYEAQARAINAIGTGDYSATGSGTPLANVPDQVLCVIAAAGDTEVDLSWLEPGDGGSAITGYHVQWREENQGWSSSRQENTTGLTDTISSLTNDDLYYFRVRAVNARGQGPWSDQVGATPTATATASVEPDAPDEPMGVTANGSIVWHWQPGSDNGADITEYQFQQRAQGGSWPGTSVSLTTPFRQSGILTNGQEYEARVRAVNSEGTSGWSDVGSATPAAETPDPLQALFGTAGNAEVDLVWGEPENNGSLITGFRIHWSTNSAFPSGNRTSIDVGSTIRTRNITGLTNGTDHYFRIRVSNGAGDSAWSPTLTLRPAAALPDAPDAPSGNARHNAIQWVLDCPSDNGSDITGFQLQWREQGFAWSGNNISTTDLAVLVTGLTNGTTYEARARAINGEGTGPWSATGSADPAATVRTFTADTTFVWPFADLTNARIEIRGGDGGGGGGGGGGGSGRNPAATNGVHTGGAGGGGGGGGAGKGGNGRAGRGTGTGSNGGATSAAFIHGAFGGTGGRTDGGRGGGRGLNGGGGGGGGGEAGEGGMDSSATVNSNTYSASGGVGGAGGNGGKGGDGNTTGSDAPDSQGETGGGEGGDGGAGGNGHNSTNDGGNGGRGAQGRAGEQVTQIVTGLDLNDAFSIEVGGVGAGGFGGGGGGRGAGGAGDGSDGSDGSAGSDNGQVVIIAY